MKDSDKTDNSLIFLTNNLTKFSNLHFIHTIINFVSYGYNKIYFYKYKKDFILFLDVMKRILFRYIYVKD